MSNQDLLIAQLQRRNRIMLGSVLVGLAVVVIGLGFFVVNTASDVALSNPTNTGETTVYQPAPANRGAADNSSTANRTNIAPDKDFPIDTNGPEISQEDKQNFLSAVQKFNNGLKTKVTNFPALTTSPAYLGLISQLESDLVTLTSQNHHKAATLTIIDATRTIKNWMIEEFGQYKKLMGDAEEAWQNKELTRLAGILANAAAIYSGEPKSVDHYHVLSADWPSVSAALQRADTALVENNPFEEQKALQNIAKLNHDVPGLGKRLASVGQRLHQQRVDDVLGRIAKAINAGDAGSARENLTRLRSLDPKIQEIPKLTADLEKLEEQIAFNNTMQAMDQLTANDNWAGAFELASKYRKQFHNYQQFQKRAEFIAQIHRLISSASDILDAPDQLIRSAAQKTAAILVADSNMALSYSPTLARISAKLEETLANYTTPLDIIVVSDTHTFVEVKSVGQVGAVTQKTIQLLPGDYVFIGKRKGYVTIEVPMELRPGDAGIKILVIANEQI